MTTSTAGQMKHDVYLSFAFFFVTLKGYRIVPSPRVASDEADAVRTWGSQRYKNRSDKFQPFPTLIPSRSDRVVVNEYRQ